MEHGRHLVPRHALGNPVTACRESPDPGLAAVSDGEEAERPSHATAGTHVTNLSRQGAAERIRGLFQSTQTAPPREPAGRSVDGMVTALVLAAESGTEEFILRGLEPADWIPTGIILLVALDPQVTRGDAR